MQTSSSTPGRCAIELMTKNANDHAAKVAVFAGATGPGLPDDNPAIQHNPDGSTSPGPAATAPDA